MTLEPLLTRGLLQWATSDPVGPLLTRGLLHAGLYEGTEIVVISVPFATGHFGSIVTSTGTS